MRKVAFRVLGAAHGIAGLVTLVVAIYLAEAGGRAALSPASHESVEIASGVVVLACLIACGVATWLRPSFAAPLAWLAAIAYFAPTFAVALRSGYGLLPAFYYSASIRLLAALGLTLLAVLPGSRLTTHSSGRSTANAVSRR